MAIALIIVGGLVLMTVSAAGFDYLAKKKKKIDDETKEKVVELEARLVGLENTISENNEKIAHLESSLAFTNKLLEDKSK